MHANDFAYIQCTLLQSHLTYICLSDIRNVSDINKVPSKSKCLNMRKLMLKIGKTRWNADICRKINLHANFLWLRMIHTVYKFLTAQWFFFNFHQMLFKENTFIWGYKIRIGFWAIDARNQHNSCRQNTVCTVSHASLQSRNIKIF